MVFSSIVFLIYFLPVFLLLYTLLPYKAKNIFLLISSILFYSWGAPKFIFVILGTTFIDFHLVKWMSSFENKYKRNLLLVCSLILNLGLLVYFKYSNFFIENLNAVLGMLGTKEITWTKLVLPIGISFYTFESITYVVDVYRKVHSPLKNFWNYQLYIILFPKLIAGPIIRYHDIADQITDRKTNINNDFFLTGFYRFILGLSKKVIIANTLGEYADGVFNNSFVDVGSSIAWFAILCYTFQIYFDFSGYSDMAIGLGKMMGFKFPENFNNPYTSLSITEFWRRWHITLGSWMKNYLYIPLGGNKNNSALLTYRNLIIVFLFSGLWHGASWNFIIWGAYHGFFLVIERLFLEKLLQKIPSFLRLVYAFIVVATGWTFFRIEMFNDAVVFIKRLYSFSNFGNLALANNTLYIFILGIFFSFFVCFKTGIKIQNFIYSDNQTLRNHSILSIVSVLLLTICISFISGSGFNPFIYFRF